MVPVQKLWRGFHQRRVMGLAASALHCCSSGSSRASQNQYRSAATTLQTRFRGFRVRRAMAAALCGAVFRFRLGHSVCESDICAMDGDFLRELKLGNDAGARASHQVVSTRIRGWNVGASWSSKSSLKHILQNRGCSNSSDSSPIVVQHVRHHQQRAQALSRIV